MSTVASIASAQTATQEPPANVPQTASPQVTYADVSRRAWELASVGRVDDALQQVKTLAEARLDDPKLASLRQDIALREQHIRDRDARTLARYERKLAKLEQQIVAGDLVKALASAVEAYGLAQDPAKVLTLAQVQQLVATAEAKAAEHEAAHDWLKALSLYRGLELLHENQDRYSEPMKRVARHVALLRLYAPEVLYQLYVKEAAERGDEAPEPWNLEEDQWQVQLENIEPLMLSESLALGARQHVEGSNFEQLLIGGIDGLMTLFETKGLETTFPSLADEQKVEAFRSYLQQTRASLVERTTPMGYAEASAIVNRIMQRNAATLNLPEAVVVHELGDGATTKLDDFTAVIWPHQKARFERTTRGEFSGVGIQISLVNRQLTVVTPLEDTPAHKAGIRSGDQIATIDGKSTVGVDLDTAVDKITGPEGTTVTLGIKSANDEKPRNITLTRSSIKIVSVKGWERKAPAGDWDYYIDPALRIGYVRMTSFGPNTADELDAAVNQMKAQGGLNGLILDLRFNPGGRLDAAVAVSDRFLDQGTIVSTTQKLLTGRPWSAEASPKYTYEPFPVVVLINKGSASASEIVAGALQDHHRALIVGENSFGKGSVQNLFRIGGERAYLKLTTQYYKVPSGRIIHRRPNAKEWGISPDVTVKMTDRQTADCIQARMVLDILRDPNDPNFDPQAVISKPSDKKADPEEEAEDKAPPVERASDLLTRGMDSQLETALLLIKTRLLGEARG
jgi:carboxyl-terminal processing protease